MCANQTHSAAKPQSGNFLEAGADFSQMNEEQRKEFWAALALKHTEGLGARGAANLLKGYGSAYAAIQAPDGWKRFNVYDSVIETFKSESWRESAGSEWALAKNPRTKILLWTNPYYPQQLKEIPDPPLFLYFQGNIELLLNPGVGVVGARRASPDALAASSRVAMELSKTGVTVISGLARGVDSEAHKAALKGPGSTIAVLGCGLDIYYPPENKALQREIANSGLLISEYTVGTKPESYHFPIRNRLISALSLGILVVEAAGRSGSLITARLALEYGREVFAIPGKFAASKAQGTHDLIRRGAKPVLDLDDMLIELLPRLKAFSEFGKQAGLVEERVETAEPDKKKAIEKPHVSSQARSSPKQKNSLGTKNSSNIPAQARYPTAKEHKKELARNILNLLENQGPLQADSICALLRVSAAKLSSELLMLELSGDIKRYPGMVYSLA